MKLGYIEDCESDFEYLKRKLKNLNFSLEYMENIAKVDKEYSILFIDVNLDNLNGFDLAAEVKEKFPDLPVILVSGEVPTADPKACNRKVADIFVTKPINTRALNACLQLIRK